MNNATHLNSICYIPAPKYLFLQGLIQPSSGPKTGSINFFYILYAYLSHLQRGIDFNAQFAQGFVDILPLIGGGSDSVMTLSYQNTVET